MVFIYRFYSLLVLLYCIVRFLPFTQTCVQCIYMQNFLYERWQICGLQYLALGHFDMRNGEDRIELQTFWLDRSNSWAAAAPCYPCTVYQDPEHLSWTLFQTLAVYSFVSSSICEKEQLSNTRVVLPNHFTGPFMQPLPLAFQFCGKHSKKRISHKATAWF